MNKQLSPAQQRKRRAPRLPRYARCPVCQQMVRVVLKRYSAHARQGDVPGGLVKCRASNRSANLLTRSR